MPSSTDRQAKVMSAIAHGWHPTGKAADIPVKVAKEFHAADSGHKYGASKTHTFGHGIGQRSGKLRTSGHPSSHRIGRK